jgi:hypothetical protein
MCELENRVADAFFDIDFAFGGPLHLFGNVWRHLKPFYPLLSNGILDGPQIPADFWFICHQQSLCTFYRIPCETRRPSGHVPEFVGRESATHPAFGNLGQAWPTDGGMRFAFPPYFAV